MSEAAERGIRKHHFISGPPRSGSTHLAAPLRQNPAFHAGVSSPVGSVFDAVLAQFSAGYADQADRRVTFDTNRMWTARMPLRMDQFPGAKVVACVRDVAWAMDSLERLYRANPYELTRLFNDTVERNRLVGFAWTALTEAFYGEHAQSLLPIDVDLLVSAPASVMSPICQFPDEAPYDHDFENIAFESPVFDAALGLHGLHRVRPRVGIEPRHTILPPDLFAQYAKLAFWHDAAGSRANAIAVTPTPGKTPQ